MAVDATQKEVLWVWRQQHQGDGDSWAAVDKQLIDLDTPEIKIEQENKKQNKTNENLEQITLLSVFKTKRNLGEWDNFVLIW